MKRVLLLWCIAFAAHAGPLALPARPQPEYSQNTGAQLPLSLGFYDDGGAPVPLGQYFNDRPVVLILGYYQCPNLCSTTMEGVLESLARAGLPPNSYRVVEVSIDPQETPELAAQKKISYEPMFGHGGAELHLLTGEKSSIALLAQTAGFHYVYDREQRQYIHPAGFIVATAAGRISRYFLGVRFDPDEVSAALHTANGGGIDGQVRRLLLLCSHFDPATGLHSVAAMALVRASALAVLTALGGWIGWMWRRHARQGTKT